MPQPFSSMSLPYLNFPFLLFFLPLPFFFQILFTFVTYSLFFPPFPLLFLYSTTLFLPVPSVSHLLSTLVHISEELHYKWKVSFFYLLNGWKVLRKENEE